jgi:hypothetical protein
MPALPPVPRPPRAELLGKLVPSSVRRLPAIARPLGPFRLAWTSILTLGVLPLIQLRERQHRTIVLQQQQIELASELLAAHVPADDAKIVQEAAVATRPSKALAGLSGVVMLAAIACAFVAIQQQSWSIDAFKQLLFHPPSPNRPFALAWLAMLTAGYGLCWVQLNNHIGKLQQFTLAFNAVAGERASPMAPPPLVFGVRPLHILVAAVMMLFWMLWALPMMLAWAAFRSFVLRSDRTFRTQLADRLTTISGEKPVVGDVDCCRNPHCRAPAPVEARYCPRCGKSVRID